MSARWPRPLFYVVVILAIALDQLAKWWATVSLLPLRTVPIIPGYFSLTYVQNTGVAFGMFAGKGLIVGLLVLALALAAFFFTRGIEWRGWEPNVVGGGLVGGALGNLLDRMRQGYVVDFFDAYVGPHHWPVFNVADSLICVSVAWIVVSQLRAKS